MRSLHPPLASLIPFRRGLRTHIFSSRQPPFSTLSRPPRHTPLSTSSLPQRPRTQPPKQHRHQTRPFTSLLTSLLPPTPTQTLHARRTLPYPPALLHALIADVDAYRFFLPHCTASRVTRWVYPPPTPPTAPPGAVAGVPSPPPQTKLPAQADLTITYGPFTQSYTSLVYSVPSPGGDTGGIVEAVSGAASTTLPPSTLLAWGYPPPSSLPHPAGTGTGTGIFESLVTRWTVSPARDGSGGAEVELTIRYRFASAALGMAVGSVAGGMVGEMVGAFEGRARRVLGRTKVGRVGG